MPVPAQSKDSIEKITTDLQAICDRLNKLATLEQNTTPKATLAKIYYAMAQLCNALVEICTLTSK
jgi:hypothetical protein